MSGCATSNNGAGYVEYLASSFTVDPVKDTSETVAGFAELETRMESACK